MKSAFVKIVRFPYLFAGVYKKRVDIDIDRKIIKSDTAEGKLKKISKWQFLAKKYAVSLIVLAIVIRMKDFTPEVNNIIAHLLGLTIGGTLYAYFKNTENRFYIYISVVLIIIGGVYFVATGNNLGLGYEIKYAFLYYCIISLIGDIVTTKNNVYEIISTSTGANIGTVLEIKVKGVNR